MTYFQDKCAALLAALLILAPTGADAQNNEAARFSLPLDCGSKFSCYLQNMVDIKPGPERLDPFCGVATYNAHKGTDIRVTDIPTMLKGIAVLATADGVVTALRDGVADRLVNTKQERAALKNRECGNGIIIKHDMPDGRTFVSQTCHLARGSVQVERGQRVRRGQQIAFMGLSGITQFPHVHISYRLNNKIIDPITGIAVGSSCKSGRSVSKTDSLFTKKAQAQIEEMTVPFLDSGFSGSPVSGVQLMRGNIRKPTQNGPLVFYARLINLKKGDQVKLDIIGPKGPYVTSTTKPLDRAKATYTAFAGKRGSLPPGTYRGTVSLIRSGEIIFSGGEKQIRF